MLKRTRLHYTGSSSEATPTSAYEQLRAVANFTKDAAGTAIRLTWVGHANMTSGGAGSVCEFQLRVDGNKDTGSASTGFESTSGASAVLYTTFSPVAVTGIFTGLAAGNHAVSIWVRAVGATECGNNNGNFGQDVWVEETT